MSKIESKETMEWKHTDWKSVENYVKKLQTKIYRASKSGDVKRMRQLQHTLSRSYRARLLAVRKVSQDNQGKRTAGIDGIKSIPPKERLALTEELKLDGKAKSVRRVQILKANGKVRNLGIPTMEDRAKQCLAKLVLEPEWEAKFKGCSYGFRPGRSCHDAIQNIFGGINLSYNKKVYEADISKCFDEIEHKYLIGKLRNFPTMRRQIKAWLKAGITIGFPKINEFQKQDKGTPQGGVISPLLANIALHTLDEYFEKIKEVKLVRYADDFVLIINNKENCWQDQKMIESMLGIILKPIGLNLSKEKSKLTDCLTEFDFIGFNVRQYEVGNYRSASKTNGQKLGIKTLIKPSKDKVLKHYQKLAEIIRTHQNAPKEALVAKLNPIIRGWCNYYSHVVSKETFSKLDHMAFLRLMRMLHRKYPNRGSKWIAENCFDRIGNRNWAFGNLLEHKKTPIVRHIKVKGNKSPFDGDVNYWGQRTQKYSGLTKRQQILFTKPKGQCNYCGAKFNTQDIELLEVDHIKPKSLGGTNELSNLQLLHRHCHDSKTANDGSLTRKKQTKICSAASHSQEYNNQPQNASGDILLW